METFTNFLAAFTTLSMEHLNALIALGALVLAAFAIYVVFAVVKERKRR